MSILAGIWFTMPIFIICAAIVSIALDRAFRWRLAAFSVGLIVVFAFQFNDFVTDVTKRQKADEALRLEKERIRKTKLGEPSAPGFIN